MPRENSFSDSEGRSLTPDLSDEEEDVQVVSPTYSLSPAPNGTQHVFGNGAGNVLGHSHIGPSQSQRSLPRSQAYSTASHVRPLLHPRERFRKAVRKIIALGRSASTFSRSRIGAVGDEPGVDPRRDSAYINWGHIHQDCVIEVNDYSSVRSSFGKMTNKEFIGMMEDERASQREPWVKVRWINVGGVSWDVLSALALKYEIHPLALEDVLHQRDLNRSKADYYNKHLFLRVLCHELLDPEDTSTYIPPHMSTSLRAKAYSGHPARGSTLTELPRSTSPAPFTPEDQENRMHHAINGSQEKEEFGIVVEGVPSSAGEFGGPGEEMDRDNTLYGNGTDITSKRKSWRRTKSAMSGVDVEKAVSPPATGRRVSFGKKPPHPPHPATGGERSLKLAKYAALDEVDEDHRKLAEREASIEQLKKGERVNVKVSPMFMFLFKDGTFITIHPSPDTNFTMPIMNRLRQRDTLLRKSADASLLLQSILDLIVDQALEVIDAYHLKIKKFERDILLKPKMKTVRNLHILSGDLILHKRTLEPIKTIVYGLRRYDLDRCAALVEAQQYPGQEKEPVVGFMTHKSKIYLADVYDHMVYILTSLDMFAGIAENLIDYTFNMASYEMNEVMRRLTLATIIFLPLTLLTGYFGMNFDPMWSVQQNSDLLFWEIAIPVMLVVIPVFVAPDIARLWHYLKKKMMTNKVAKVGSFRIFFPLKGDI
ncbi:hypothetical protein ONZ45_g15609 [Pleurotus djamor]|nr:hypothetical protein ONZ45_g15609 [Pleurotus djamor]